MTRSPHGLRMAFRPLARGWEQYILSRALRHLRPTHPAVPEIVRRLHAGEHAPSPLHPHDSIVVGASLIGALALLGMVAVGWVR